MARKSIWFGICAFIIAMLVSAAPFDGRFALTDISLGGSPAEAKKGGGNGPGHRPFKGGPDLPSIFDTLEDLDLDVDDGGGPDDEDDGPETDDDDGGPDED